MEEWKEKLENVLRKRRLPFRAVAVVLEYSKTLDQWFGLRSVDSADSHLICEMEPAANFKSPFITQTETFSVCEYCQLFIWNDQLQGYTGKSVGGSGQLLLEFPSAFTFGRRWRMEDDDPLVFHDCIFLEKREPDHRLVPFCLKSYNYRPDFIPRFNENCAYRVAKSADGTEFLLAIETEHPFRTHRFNEQLRTWHLYSLPIPLTRDPTLGVVKVSTDGRFLMVAVSDDPHRVGDSHRIDLWILSVAQAECVQHATWECVTLSTPFKGRFHIVRDTLLVMHTQSLFQLDLGPILLHPPSSKPWYTRMAAAIGHFFGWNFVWHPRPLCGHMATALLSSFV